MTSPPSLAPTGPAPSWSQEAERLSKRRVSSLIGMGVVILSLVSAGATFVVLAGFMTVEPSSHLVLAMFGLNVLLIGLLLIIVILEALALFRARRAQAAGAKLHGRIMRWFGFVATAPAILMAVIAMITLDRGLDPWFSSSVSSVITRSVEIAKEYTETQCRMMTREIGLMAGDLDRAKPMFDEAKGTFSQFLTNRAKYLGFPHVMLVKSDGTILDKVELAQLDGALMPEKEDFEAAADGEPWCFIPKEGNVFRLLLKLNAYPDTFVFAGRPVDPRALEFPAVAEAGLVYYRALEERKGGIKFAFATLYTMIALVVPLCAAWLGLSFANRLVAPVRRLITAADQVSTGNFALQVPIRESDGDLAFLGRTFNKMTEELRRQRDRLVDASAVIDERRRFTEAVLSGVSAGVIGLDNRGSVTVVNPSAQQLLQIDPGAALSKPLAEIWSELAALIAKSGRSSQQHQMSLVRNGRERLVNVRVTTERSPDSDERGQIITIDDITDLVTAQRTSAWADVARRIAHEIKNPLTPIQLSAERIRRKYGRVITDDRAVFDQCTETIIRQVDDIKRMVDEFSSFARMPKPTPESDDLSDLVRQTVFMMRVGNPDIEIADHVPDRPIVTRFDRRLIGQALTNVVKNATEAISGDKPISAEMGGRVDVSLAVDPQTRIITIDIDDNGKGFPVENRQRLLEPYMTTRESGTGLGLAIVGKILEDHGGGIELLDNPRGRGARVRLWFPIIAVDQAPAAKEPVEQMI
ncbi:PAS domain-containing sensor histidine kinase [Terrarubrum flagellatum]|uniref:sensor histidine kinase NtrY-like n=1 Tax=Terrirubrum flagellatum TaxID=2895980 RepID=UPI0031452810